MRARPPGVTTETLLFLDHDCHSDPERFTSETQHFSADYGGQRRVQHGGRIPGQCFCRRRGYMRLSEGRTLAFFADSTFPPPPVQICEETKSPTGEGD